MTEGIPSIKFVSGTCKGCIVGNHADHNYEKGGEKRATEVLELVHLDIIGPLPTLYYGR